MKKARDAETFRTIPDGCYECGSLSEEEGNKKEKHDEMLTTDLQGNGYPAVDSEEGK